MKEDHAHERPFFIQKDLLDTGNSVSWFFMDACWMIGWIPFAYAMVLPTVLSGLFLLYIEKRKSVFCINLSINFWILMNCFWMFGDTLQDPNYLVWSKISFGLGIFSILLAAYFSKDLKETFSHFKRFRIFKFQ